jgi:flagellar basal-body rod protein FlgG
MYTMQGIVRKGINNATTQMDRLGAIANNIANYTTNGYKSVTFEQVLKEDGYLTRTERTDYATGSTRVTSNPYNVALKDVGFIPVVSPEGEIAYTRDGSFTQGKDGYLTTSDGWLVGDGIKIPTNCYKFTIKENGEVFTKGTVDGVEKKIGTIPLVRFDNPQGLKQADMNRLLPTDESGDAKLVKNPDCFAQNNLEMSNTNIYDSLNDILRVNASLLASTKMMKVADDMYNKAINIRES